MGSRQHDETHKEHLVSVHAATEVCSAPALPSQCISERFRASYGTMG